MNPASLPDSLAKQLFDCTVKPDPDQLLHVQREKEKPEKGDSLSSLEDESTNIEGDLANIRYGVRWGPRNDVTKRTQNYNANNALASSPPYI